MKPYVFMHRGKSPYWQVRITHEGRVLEQKSLGTEDKERAWSLAMILCLGYEATVHGKMPKSRLRNVLRELYNAGTADEWKLYSVQEYFYEWLGTRDLFAAGSTVANQTRAIRLFEEFMDDKMDMLLDQLHPQHIRDWVYWLVHTKKHGKSSANHRLESLATVLGRAVEDRLITENPCTGIEVKVRKSTHTNQIDTYHPFTYEQIKSLIEKGIAPGLNPEMAIASMVALDLGGRKGDMFGLLRRDFTLDDGLVSYHVRKVVKIHDVIMFPATVALLKEYLDQLPDKRTKAPLFPTFHVPNADDVADDVFMKSSGHASTYFGMFLQAVGIRPAKPPRIVNDKAKWDHSFHSFRPTVSSALKLAGVPLQAVMARMPHKSEEVSKKYNRFTVHNICQRVFEGVGLPVPEDVKAKTSVTMTQIFELLDLARQRLVQCRGQLDFSEPKHGMASWRAKLLPPEKQLHWRTVKKMNEEAAKLEPAEPLQIKNPILT